MSTYVKSQGLGASAEDFVYTRTSTDHDLDVTLEELAHADATEILDGSLTTI